MFVFQGTEGDARHINKAIRQGQRYVIYSGWDENIISISLMNTINAHWHFTDIKQVNMLHTTIKVRKYKHSLRDRVLHVHSVY